MKVGTKFLMNEHTRWVCLWLTVHILSDSYMSTNQQLETLRWNP
jgi:hypothetical protein